MMKTKIKKLDDKRDIGVRGVNTELWLEFRSLSSRRDVPLGDLLNEALNLFFREEKKKSLYPNRQQELTL